LRGLRRPQYRLRVDDAQIKDDFSGFPRPAEDGEIVITRHGRPAGVLIGFASEDDWLDYRLENHPGFLERIAEARAAFRRGEGVPIEDVED
jgi:prevent-host-death family protein